MLVGLGTKRLHRRSLALVEQPYLDKATVCHPPHQAAERVYLAHKLPFGWPPNTGVARHLRYLVQVYRKEQSAAPHPRRSVCRFAAGVACTNNHNIIDGMEIIVHPVSTHAITLFPLSYHDIIPPTKVVVDCPTLVCVIYQFFFNKRHIEELSLATILIIDDDVALLARLGAQLEQEGYDVLKMSAARPAEVLFDEHHPDLVLLEVKMDRDEGWRLLTRFAQQTHVIVISSSSREQDVVRSLEAGAVDFVPKPYRSTELLARIRLRLNHASSNGSLKKVTPVASSPTLPRPPSPQPPVLPPSLPRPAPTTEQEKPSSSSTPSLPSPPSQPLPRLPSPPSSPPSSPIRPSPPTPPTEQEKPPLSAKPLSEPVPIKKTFLEQRGRGKDLLPRPDKDDDSIFVSETEEMSLLRSRSTVQDDELFDDTLPEDATLGRRLYKARRQRRLTLVQAENDLHIRMWYLQAMEEEKFSLLPRGPVAVHMLRSYTTYLGLDVNQAVRDYEQYHASGGIEPKFSPMGPRPPLVAPPTWIIWTVAAILALSLSGTAIYVFDPIGVSTLGENLRSLIVSPPPTPTPSHMPVLAPTVGATTTPTRTPTPHPTRTPTPLQNKTPAAPWFTAASPIPEQPPLGTGTPVQGGTDEEP